MPACLLFPAGIERQLVHAYSIEGLTSFFEGIEYLAGGSFLMADLTSDEITKQPYWQLSPLSEEAYAADQRTFDSIIEGYRELLADAVKIRLMADVEVGLFLSGGIDSVSVAAFAAREQPLQTFSVLSQSTFQNGDARAGHLAAHYLGLPNHQVLFSWHDVQGSSGIRVENGRHTPKSPCIRSVTAVTPRMHGDLGVCCRCR